MGDDGGAETVTVGTAPRRTAPILKALALALSLAAVVLFGGCGSAATTAGSGADASAGVAATGGATQPPAQPLPARTPKTPRPTPTVTPSGSATPGSTASGGAGKGASGATTVVFVDVGQGDATVIKSGSWTGLIDGGPPGSEPVIEAAYTELGQRRRRLAHACRPHGRAHAHRERVAPAHGLRGGDADLGSGRRPERRRDHRRPGPPRRRAEVRRGARRSAQPGRPLRRRQQRQRRAASRRRRQELPLHR